MRAERVATKKEFFRRPRLSQIDLGRPAARDSEGASRLSRGTGRRIFFPPDRLLRLSTPVAPRGGMPRLLSWVGRG